MVYMPVGGGVSVVKVCRFFGEADLSGPLQSLFENKAAAEYGRLDLARSME
jgi:hypothetical protein